MRIIITGSRDWSDPNYARKLISDRLAEIPPPLDEVVIVHGNARGVDRFAHDEANKAGLLVEPHPWKPHGHPLKRNQYMIDLGADLVIAIWDGKSRGTRDTIERAEKAGIPVEIIYG